jgi:tRNA threonylcarbamoyladenosine biosynthesis protein TsaB
MKLLAIDTATEACSVALLVGQTMIQRYEEPGRGHAERILPMVGDVLKEAAVALADLDAIAVGRGPGAFTGVRIAISVAQGLGFGADKPVVPVSDLAALAQRAADERGARKVIASIDARMHEVYWGVYAVDSSGLVVATGDERVDAPAHIEFPPDDEWFAAGSGWATGELSARLATQAVPSDARLLPRAREVALLGRRDFELGRAVRADQAMPVYLRDRVATVPGRH